MSIIKDTNFRQVRSAAKLDSRNRLALPAGLCKQSEQCIFNIYTNDLGQIVLDPQVTVPASEAWFWQKPEHAAAFRKGIADIKEGKVTELDPKDLDQAE